MMNRTKYYIPVLLCLLSTAFAACIKEDLSDCPPSDSDAGKQIEVVFTYEDAAQLTSSDLKKVTLLVFDEAKTLVASWTQESPVLDSIYTPDFKLVPGEYHLVAWMNAQEPYTINPLSKGRSSAEVELRLLVPSNREISENLPLLLYGNLPAAKVNNAGNERFTIPLVRNTNQIHIRAIGLPQTTDIYRFAVTDDNGNYTFENRFAACDTLSYISDVNGSTSSDTLQTTLSVLKLTKDREHPVVTVANHTLKFKLYSCNLIQKILADYPDNDFDKNHTYYITIRFNEDDLTDTDVSVGVNDWVSDGSNHQLEP